MLKITIPKSEFYDSKANEFLYINETHLSLEHSLVSISKWESKFKKPFLSSKKSDYEIREYIKFMTLTQNVNPLVYKCIPQKEIKKITDYISDAMTATRFSGKSDTHDNEIVTSEIIYYWMIALNIPMECQKWHLNRLLTLIRVVNIKVSPPKKRSSQEIALEYSEISRKRREQYERKDKE